MLALISAIDALRTANLLAEKPLYTFQLTSVDGQPVCGDLGFATAVDHSFKSLDIKSLDALIVCGGLRTNLANNDVLKRFLQRVKRARSDGHGEPPYMGIHFGSLWNGVFALGHAGLLDHVSCTVHRENRASFRELFPNVQLLDLPVVHDGTYFSCAGGQSALDMTLDLITASHGKQFVRGVCDILTCDRLTNTNELAKIQDHSNQSLPQHLGDVITLMENNMEEMLTPDELASLVGITRRQVERLFQRYLGTSPTRYYLELRLTRANQLLIQTQLSMSDIALACGFVSYPHFSKCYRQFYNQPPSSCRK